ncbi:Transcription factor [Metarhizium rileyi]|uniref:Transcription factor n=1 Tax=Metarhizium rileyi (strain RCEF 4871) TaxID=1649241 RepID=A0A162M6Z9_METRR|nr:Transcription factor [Metarhizium rileyi RCEF 4871]
MLPIHALEGAPPLVQGTGLALGEAAQSRDPKPKTLPCKYCSKRFRFVPNELNTFNDMREHIPKRSHLLALGIVVGKPLDDVDDSPPLNGNCTSMKQAHEHDLLVRHEKLVHLHDGNKDGKQQRRASSSTTSHKAAISDSHLELEPIGLHTASMNQHGTLQHQQQPQHQHQPAYHHTTIGPGVGSGHHHLAQDPHSATPRSAACNLDVLSDAALATEVITMPPMLDDMSQQGTVHHDRVKSFDESIGEYSERPRQEQSEPMLSSDFAPQPSQRVNDDYNLFLDEFAGSAHILPPHFESDQQFSMWARAPGQFNQRGNSRPSSQFPSRFGSLAPDFRDPVDTGQRLLEDSSRANLRRISVADHKIMKGRLDEFSTVLPSDFIFPSRHTLSRFLEGYINGFHDHLPFLHIPTLAPVDMAPELLLAVLAVGAQHRFERNRGYALWYAAKAVAMEQIRRRHSSEVHALLPTAASYSPHSTRPSPSISYRHTFASAQSERPVTHDTHREPYSPNTPGSRLATIQAVLLLFAVGLWGAKTILQEALSLQSNLAMLIREESLNVETSPSSINEWETWIRLEGSNRTKLIAFCFFNLCSTAYNVPPLLLTAELDVYMPVRSRLWRAESAWQWQELRQVTPVADVSVFGAFSRLFGRTTQGLPNHLSALGHYILIHALIQHIYLLKQTSFAAGSLYDVQRTLKPEDVDEVSQALRVWQASFEHRHQLRAAESGHSMNTDSSTGGSLTFNATALLRLAYIRLYTDIPPNRALETRDPMMIASALNGTPLLHRGLSLHRAVFQAVHVLSMLVKAGVNYVARAKSAEWSIQHSLCNFESALLLAKWLVTLSAITPSDPAASPEERSLLQNVQRMLDETEFAVPIDPSLAGPMDMATSDSAKLRQLASAVVRLWAETFKGTHIFDLVKVMGPSLDGYAALIDKSRERTPPMIRMGPEVGMT